MVDIHSATAEIRRGKEKKEEERKKNKPQGKNIMSASATQGGYNKTNLTIQYTATEEANHLLMYTL